VPEEKSSEALQDVMSVMERSMPAIRKSARRASKDGPVMTWLLHGFTFAVDAGGSWRLKGEEGMAKLFALTAKIGKHGDGDMIRVIATKEFLDASRAAEGLKVSEELEKAGMKLERG
jgi:hypothetical protein